MPDGPLPPNGEQVGVAVNGASDPAIVVEGLHHGFGRRSTRHKRKPMLGVP